MEGLKIADAMLESRFSILEPLSLCFTASTGTALEQNLATWSYDGLSLEALLR